MHPNVPIDLPIYGQFCRHFDVSVLEVGQFLLPISALKTQEKSPQRTGVIKRSVGVERGLVRPHFRSGLGHRGVAFAVSFAWSAWSTCAASLRDALLHNIG